MKSGTAKLFKCYSCAHTQTNLIFLIYFSIPILCDMILIICYISDGNITLFTSLHLSDSFADKDFTNKTYDLVKHVELL